MTTHDASITGQVAALLNDRELAINRGSIHGVQVGMRFKVLNDVPSEIFDPETGEEIGQIDHPKVRIEITAVHDKFAVASTFQETRVNVGGVGAGIAVAQIFAPPKWESRIEKLPAGEPTFLESAKESMRVKTGDKVVEDRDQSNTVNIA